MIRIMNLSTGEYNYILPEDNIPDGWILYPYTIKTDVSASNLSSWFWLLLILVLLIYGAKKWTR
jgi:hypothetical protein